jgi:hypothetical protein
MIHKTRQNTKRSHKKRTGYLWTTRYEIQIQTKLDQPSQKNGQHQTSDACPSEGEEVVDAPGKDGDTSMPEQIKQPNPWRCDKLSISKNMTVTI